MTYYELHKADILKKQNEYNEKNKDKIYNRLGKIKCDSCSTYYTPKSKERHERTKKHCKSYNYNINNNNNKCLVFL